ncbi:phage-like protein [Salmonella bongori]|nr:phage-like protein [Salmonella bongori]
MSPTARHEAGGWMPWAKSQGISISNAYSYLTNNGLTRRGMERLHSTEERGVHITQGQLQAWLNMSPEARSEVGDWMTWAQTQGISIRSARKYLTNAGLTPFGMERLQSPEKRISRITKEQLQAWLNMSPEARSGGRRLEDMGASAGNINQQCQKISDERRTNSPRHGTTAAS